jgi:hypothetical protein
MNISKKVDTIFPKDEIPLLISYPFNLGRLKVIRCNYGELVDDIYKLINVEKKDRKENLLPGAIDELITYDCSLWDFPDEVEQCKKRKRTIYDNTFEIPSKDEYLVVTLSFLFDLWDFSANAGLLRIKEGPIGVIKTKINWKKKEDILPATFTSDDVVDLMNRVSVELEGREFCNTVSYDVDLVIYGKGIQYFKGHIKYIVSTFSEKNTLGDEDAVNLNYYANLYKTDDRFYECQNPAEIYEAVTLEKYPEQEPLVFHINFIGTKYRD